MFSSHQTINRRFSVAPMLDWTDRHCRYFYRLMTKEALLYSEMVTTGAILYGDHKRHLAFSKEELPLALQLGGSDPKALATCAKIAEDYGYSEVNLNCGCPSDRVQKGMFGACLMREPDLVAECFDAMQSAVNIPITIKTRIGVDHDDTFEFLDQFIATTKKAGCKTYILHARKAWLSGLSPKENREVPPLDYTRVYAIKERYTDLEIIINGGISTLDAGLDQLNYVEGVMLGRTIYHEPYLLSLVDQRFFGANIEPLSREEILYQLKNYINAHIKNGGALKHIARHLLGLFHGVPNSRLWRRTLSEAMHQEGADYSLIEQAFEKIKAVADYS